MPTTEPEPTALQKLKRFLQLTIFIVLTLLFAIGAFTTFERYQEIGDTAYIAHHVADMQARDSSLSRAICECAAAEFAKVTKEKLGWFDAALVGGLQTASFGLVQGPENKRMKPFLALVTEDEANLIAQRCLEQR